MQLIDQLASLGGKSKTPPENVPDGASGQAQDGQATPFLLDIEPIGAVAPPAPRPAMVPKLAPMSYAIATNEAGEMQVSAAAAPYDLATQNVEQAQQAVPLAVPQTVKATPAPTARENAFDALLQADAVATTSPQEAAKPVQRGKEQDMPPPAMSQPEKSQPDMPEASVVPPERPMPAASAKTPPEQRQSVLPPAASQLEKAGPPPDIPRKKLTTSAVDKQSVPPEVQQTQNPRLPDAGPAIVQSPNLAKTGLAKPESDRPDGPQNLKTLPKSAGPLMQAQPAAEMPKTDLGQSVPQVTPKQPAEPKLLSVPLQTTGHETAHKTPVLTPAEPLLHMQTTQASTVASQPLFEPQLGLALAPPSGHASPLATAPVATATPAQTSYAVHQITTQIATEAGAVTSRDIEVRLDPEELGRVRITVHPRETGLFIALAVERPETLELLRKNADELMSNLQEFDLSEATIDFSQEGDSPPSDPDAEPPDQQDAPVQLTLTEQISYAMPQNDGRLDLRL